MASVSEAPGSVEQTELQKFDAITANSRGTVRFPNWWSRAILGRLFDRQFIVPEDPPWAMETMLGLLQRTVIRPDISNIKVDRPIFLIGLPRSGTSMLQDIMCAHGDLAYVTNSMHSHRRVFCAAEVMRKKLNIDCMGSRYLGDSVEVSAGSPNDAVCFWGEWLKYGVYDLDYVERKLSDYSEADLERIRDDIKKMIWCFGGGNKRFCTKNPMLIPDIVLVGQIFPDAKFVHIIRDARMSANSMRKLYWLEASQLAHMNAKKMHNLCDQGDILPYPRVPGMKEFAEQYGDGDIRTTAHVWRASIEFVEQNKDKLPSYHEVRYEDIQTDPAGELAKIFDFCELSPIGEDNHAYWERINSVGKLKHKNTYGDFDVIEDICREPMQRHGYL